VFVWGSVARSTRAATWCFYTDDYRFDALWRAPERVVKQSSAGAFEINFSVFDASPRALAVWEVYRKRFVAKLWQEQGLRVWVDLCFAHRHSDLALLGVPRGWQRFCTAGFDARVTDLDFELRQARRHADGAPFTLAVYGGGRATLEWCSRHPDVIHIPRRTAGQQRPGEGTRRAAMRAAHG
jgi:hypothetical protein